MNKKNINDMLVCINTEIQKIRGDIEQLKGNKEPKGRWKPKKGKKYYFVNEGGTVNQNEWHDDILFKCGNCFEIREEAKATNLYKLLNSEYEYYIAGVSALPDYEVGEHEIYSWSDKEWKVSFWHVSKWFQYDLNRRWKRK